jgi:hypothetical protein
VRSLVACLPDRPAACPFAAYTSEPDQPQAVKAGAVAPPLRGFGLDGLTPPRCGLSKQTRADWGRTTLLTRTCSACSTHVLTSGCDNARSVDRKALEGRGRDAHSCALTNKPTPVRNSRGWIFCGSFRTKSGCDDARLRLSAD